MGKIECTKISGHFLQFALWFKNGRFHWTLIRPREKTVSSTPSFPTWLKRADALLLWLTLDYSLPRLRRNLSLGLSGAGFAPSEVGPRRHRKSICMLQESNQQGNFRWAAIGHTEVRGVSFISPQRGQLRTQSPGHTPLLQAFLGASNNFFKRFL